MDYVKRYPETIPLKTMQATMVAQALFHYFSQVGIPWEIFTVYGSAFTSALMKSYATFLRSSSSSQLFTNPNRQISCKNEPDYQGPPQEDRLGFPQSVEQVS